MTNMETLFIGYPPCSTCKKAYKALQDLGIEATYRNLRANFHISMPLHKCPQNRMIAAFLEIVNQ